MASVLRASILSLAAVLVLGCGSTPPAGPGTAAAGLSAGPGANPGEGVTSSLPPPVDIGTAGAAAIDATYAVASLVLASGKAWVAGMGNGIGVLDATGRLTKSVPVDGPCRAMDVGFAAVWTATCAPGGIARIDARSGAVDSVTLDDPIVDTAGSIGAGDAVVWLVAGAASDQLLGIDPSTLNVTTRYDIAPGAAGVRAGFGGVWVTRPDADEVLRVDAASGQSVSIHVGGRPRFLAIGAGAVWVLGGLGTVTRLDPATNAVMATIRLESPVDEGGIAVGGGRVWIRGGSELLTCIDPATNLVTQRYGPASGGGSVAVGDDAVWVTSPEAATIWRLPLH